MANLVADGDLSLGGAAIELSGGTKYAIFVALNILEVYKDIDGARSLEDSDTAAAVHGGDNIAYVDAALRSDGDIDIVSVCDAEQTRDVAFAIFDTSAGTLGAWAEAADYTNAAPTNPGCSISIGSTDIPHILYVDVVTYHGTDYDQIMHAEDDGGWGTELVCDTPNKDYRSPRITCCLADDLEALYRDGTTADPTYKRKNAGWGAEGSYAKALGVNGIGGVTCTVGDTVYRYYCHATATMNIEESNADTGYDADTTSYRVSPALSPTDGTTRYIFYIDTNDDVHVISSAWVDEGAQQAGTFLYVIAEWAYNNENQSGEINYIFDDGTDVFYDSFSLAVGPAGVKTILGIAVGSIKTINDVALSLVKTINDSA